MSKGKCPWCVKFCGNDWCSWKSLENNSVRKRNISEIYKDMDNINKRKPTAEKLDKLVNQLNKIKKV